MYVYLLENWITSVKMTEVLHVIKRLTRPLGGLKMWDLGWAFRSDAQGAKAWGMKLCWLLLLCDQQAAITCIRSVPSAPRCSCNNQDHWVDCLPLGIHRVTQCCTPDFANTVERNKNSTLPCLATEMEREMEMYPEMDRRSSMNSRHISLSSSEIWK